MFKIPKPMRTIAEIFLFKTPFESAHAFADRFRKITEMFEDYLKNSGLPLAKTSASNENFSIQSFIDPEEKIEIIYAFQSDLGSASYYPAGIITYKLDTFAFDKKNTEAFLNDVIKFVSNVFFEEFFLDIDSAYKIADFSQGKKVDLESLGKFDVRNPKSRENKKLLDGLMYTYFLLAKNMWQIENDNFDLFMKNNTLTSMEGQLELFRARSEETKVALATNALQIKNQIDAFIKLIS